MPIGEHDKKLIDAFPEALLLVEKRGKVLSANKAALELLGRDLDRLTGSDLSSVVTDDSSQLSLYLGACSRAAQFHIGSFQVQKDSGQQIACRFDGALVTWTGENILLIRLTPRTTASTPFIALNEQIESLNRARHGLENEVRLRTAELLNAQTKLRELSAQLMLAQDEERRRLARELHDSTGQTLTAIQLNLSVLMNELSLSPEDRARIEQTVDLTNQAIGEVRTISHLLHPPMLDEAGLFMALRTFIEGFEERSRIVVATNLPASFERLNPEMETALFRVVQECLTNVHRHSGSKDASIRLARENGCVVLEVVDFGRGMCQVNDGSPQKTGVGIRGMQERVRLCSTALWNFSTRGQERWSALSCPAHPNLPVESMPIRIFLADDHDIVREGVKSLLKSHPEWTICDEASDGMQAESLIGRVDCDIAILDISMPGKSGLEVAAAVSRKHPGLKILIFTMHSGKTLHSAAREVGAHGVVQKSFASRDLIRAIESLIAGGNFFPQDSALSSVASPR